MSLSQTDRESLPIGVFDSGVGGLTVLRAIHRALPGEDLLYLGDTARVPYGTKSAESVCRYAMQASRALIDRRIKALVVACNTASAVALEALQEAHPEIPVIGVIEPGARASCSASRSGGIAVIATEGTVSGGAYDRAIQRIRPDARVTSKACSLFVALAEEGWTEGELLDQVLARYLDPLLKDGDHLREDIDCLVLGCTHFPVLKEAIARVTGPSIQLVDSAETTAHALRDYLREANSCRAAKRVGDITFMVTDGPQRFARVATHFFGRTIHPEQVETVDIHQTGIS